MSPLEAIGLVSGIASIAGLIYAVYYGRASARAKLLAYEITPPVPLATVLQPDESHHLSILYRRGDGPDERVDAAYIQFIRFANFGREPIRRNDIAPANPLRVEVSGARTLDISLVSSRRSVSSIAIESHLADHHGATALITFDFLDYQDGGLLRIVTANEIGAARLSGDIIGMPQGIRRSEDIRPHSFLNFLGCSLGGAVQLGALAVTPFVYRWAVGTWEHIWVLILPLLALILPGAIFGLIASTIWPQSNARFPTELSFPHWYSSRLRLLTDMHLHMHEPMWLPENRSENTKE